MKKCTLAIEKLSEEQPVTELKATVTLDNGKSLSSLYSRNMDAKQWQVVNTPNYKAEFDLNDEQVNDIILVLDDLIDTYANGNKEKGFRSMLQTSLGCKLKNELSWLQE
ncbi:hypothetical protein [Vibrio parahaemolyticus]|uniref:hypothetical protein n=1 Tax=Vibrio parahaemolyticus TaxID=670 RepID=UPI00047265B9|nr:hypothetical protein [Vibrio parahaemolyticus]HCG8575868.1 hypothetical protein [Vibrio parahaemolyticus]